MLAEIGRASGWAGLVLYGCTRDVAEIGTMDFAICALGSSPKKSAKAGTGAIDVPVTLGGVDFVPGQYLYADEDGILVAGRPVHTENLGEVGIELAESAPPNPIDGT